MDGEWVMTYDVVGVNCPMQSGQLLLGTVNYRGGELLGGEYK